MSNIFSTSDASVMKSGYRDKLRWMQWIIIPVIVFIGFEVAFENWLLSIPSSGESRMWESILTKDSKHSPDCLFIGVSRTACAIDTDVFNKESLEWRGKSAHSVNLGYGWSTPNEHYLALRNYLEAGPDRLKGRTVFIEAYTGIPFSTDTQNESWFHPDRPQMLIDVIKPSDLSNFCSSGSIFEDKIGIVTFTLLRAYLPPNTSIQYIDRIRTGILSRGNNFTTKVLSRWIRNEPDSDSNEFDLKAAGGVRNDRIGIENARAIAIQYAKKSQSENRSPRDDWDNTAVGKMVKLVNDAGGKVVFYDMPLHSLQAEEYKTPNRQIERESFLKQTIKWDTPILSPKIKFKDDDFPDIWHLRKSLASDYTKALIKEWKKTENNLK